MLDVLTSCFKIIDFPKLEIIDFLIKFTPQWITIKELFKISIHFLIFDELDFHELFTFGIIISNLECFKIFKSFGKLLILSCHVVFHTIYRFNDVIQVVWVKELLFEFLFHNLQFTFVRLYTNRFIKYANTLSHVTNFIFKVIN